MSIHRIEHEAYSLFVAQAKLHELLEGVYDTATATIIRSEILHAIIAHRSGGSPLTVEAGIVRGADALDRAKGRSRISFEAGPASIHSVAAQAKQEVVIEHGGAEANRHTVQMINA